MPETWLGHFASILLGAAPNRQRKPQERDDGRSAATRGAAFIDDLDDRMRDDIGVARNPREGVKRPFDLGWPGVRGW